MTVTFIICTAFLLLGAFLGKKLAKRGINADKSLDKHQGLLLIIFGAIGILFAALLVLDRYNLAYWLPRVFPSFILIYLGGYYQDLILVLGCFSLGLLVSLDLFGKSDFAQKFQLSLAVAVITCALAVLLYYLLPIDKLVKEPKIVDGVVFQTTPYTCAPSSIATLTRFFGNNPNMLEEEVTKLAGTNLFGTTTLAEIETLQKLDFKPKYEHNLTIEQLTKIGKPGLLHVKEKYDGSYTGHTIALLGIDIHRELILVANPLYGKQIKTFQEMEGYWFGEGIFIN
jgi:hypothetical protein